MATRLVHLGARTGSVQLELRQSERIRVHGVALSLNSASALKTTSDGLTTAMPGPHECEAWSPGGDGPGYADNLELRLVARDDASDRAQVWLRLTDGDTEQSLGGPAAVAAVFLDAVPPILMLRSPRPRFVPSVEFTLHLAPLLPSFGPRWFLATNDLLWSNGEFCAERSTLRTTDGELVAELRQTRAIEWSDRR